MPSEAFPVMRFCRFQIVERHIEARCQQVPNRSGRCHPAGPAALMRGNQKVHAGRILFAVGEGFLHLLEPKCSTSVFMAISYHGFVKLALSSEEKFVHADGRIFQTAGLQ